MKKVVLELDRMPLEGEILIFRDGKLQSVEIHELLPELKIMKQDIKKLQEFKEDADTKIKELRGEDDEKQD